MRQRVDQRNGLAYWMWNSHITHMKQSIKACRNQRVSKINPTLVARWAPSMPILAAGRRTR